MPGPLAHIRVLDFGQYIAGPMAALLLADQGADVLHVDPPGGPRWASDANAVLHRGKRCVELDLTDPAARARALELVAAADVVIENFRPGVMSRLGLDPQRLLSQHPTLIWCSLPGFAADDARAGLPAWEGVVAAATDTYRPLPGAAGPEADRPAFLGIPVASNFAAMLGAQGIVAALVARDRDGLGQHVEVPLFHATFAAIGARAMRQPGPPDPPPLDWTGFGIYRCADGRSVHFAPVEAHFMEGFAAAAGLESWRAEGLLDRARLAREPAHTALLRQRLSALFASQPAAYWEALGAAAGAPLAPCLTTAEWLAHPQARESRAAVPLDDPQLGLTVQPGLAVRLSGHPDTPADARRAVTIEAAIAAWPLRSVTLGASLDASPDPPRRPASRRPALDGLRVIDLTQVWAGPTAARALAEYGADVIKVLAPGRAIFTHADVNRGKRSIVLDLADEADRATLLDLVAGADVVMHNFRRGVAERLGIGEVDLRRLRPDLVYANISCYGHEGPWGDRRGYEVQGQACAGAQATFGTPEAPLRLPYEINDYGTGVLGSLAVLLGVLDRCRTGRGRRVDAALAWTAALHQTAFMPQHARKRWDEPRGPGARGFSPLQRLFRAADGWLFLGVHETQRRQLVDGLRLPMDALGNERALADAAAATIATLPVADACEKLQAAGLGAHPLTPVAALIEDPDILRRGLVMTRDHPGLGAVTTIGPVVALSGTPLQPGRVATPPGTEGPEIRRACARARDTSKREET